MAQVRGPLPPSGKPGFILAQPNIEAVLRVNQFLFFGFLHFCERKGLQFVPCTLNHMSNWGFTMKLNICGHWTSLNFSGFTCIAAVIITMQYSTHCVSGTVLTAVLTHFVLTATMSGKYYCYPCVTNEERRNNEIKQ